ncbi:MAG: hypothetical protein LBT79_07445 [Elusimicrobiota bacterium]|jgi:hypothetical protein|nr:hypothetical protein [Elusimicrobiota bacterium]
MILELVSAGIPLITNAVKSITETKQKKIDAGVKFSELDLEALKIKVDLQKSNNDFEISRMNTISQTFKTGNNLIDALQGSVRVGLGYIVIAAILQTIIAYSFGYKPMLDMETIKTICSCVVYYFLAAYSCQKVF